MHILSLGTDNCPSCRKYFTINLHERMLPTSAGVEPVTSWSQVGRASNWATEAKYCLFSFIVSRLKIKLSMSDPLYNTLHTEIYQVGELQLTLFSSNTDTSKPLLTVFTLLCFRHLSESRFLHGALNRRSKFANFCHDLMQNHLSNYLCAKSFILVSGF